MLGCGVVVITVSWLLSLTVPPEASVTLTVIFWGPFSSPASAAAGIDTLQLPLLPTVAV